MSQDKLAEYLAKDISRYPFIRVESVSSGSIRGVIPREVFKDIGEKMYSIRRMKFWLSFSSGEYISSRYKYKIYCYFSDSVSFSSDAGNVLSQYISRSPTGVDLSYGDGSLSSSIQRRGRSGDLSIFTKLDEDIPQVMGFFELVLQDIIAN